MEAYLETLKHEFAAEEGSFLLQLHDMTWDKAAFSRLVTAMQECCKALEGADTLPRWIAEGFWYVSWYVHDWSSHENFPRPHPQDYYAEAYSRLFELASWFFFGTSPYLPGSQIEPI